MSSKKLLDDEKKISPFWNKVTLLCKSEGINEKGFRKRTGLSSSYLTELKYGRARATGGKMWFAIKREFPHWEDYLRDLVESPPGTSGSTPGSTILTGHIQPYEQEPEHIGRPGIRIVEKEGLHALTNQVEIDGQKFSISRYVDPEWIHQAVDEILASDARETILALESNVRVFLDKIKKERQLEERISTLEKELSREKNSDDSSLLPEGKTGSSD